MKPSIEKLYAKTPADALATLASGAFLRADNDEMHRIARAIGGQQVNSQLLYSHHQHGLTTTTLLWCLDCRSTYSNILELLVVLGTAGLEEKNSLLVRFLARATQGRLASLLEAMRQICTNTGLNFNDIEQAAGIADMNFRQDVPAIPAAVTEFIEQYRLPDTH